MSDRRIHVIGGGLAGLVAAITAAEGGAPVTLYEASDRLGGRALGGAGRTGVNLGPHVLFTDGAVLRWLGDHGIPLALRMPPTRGALLLDDRGPHVPFGEVPRLVVTLRRVPAPVEVSFREWTDARFGSSLSDLLCRLTGLFTFHHDPGSLSARFVWDRYRRTFLRPDRVRWVAGGWGTLVDALEARARALGVEVEAGARVTAASLPDGPVVVATPLAEAARLLDRRLRWPGARTALLDVVARSGARWPALVADVRSDLATCCMLERQTAMDPGVAGPGMELFQAHLGIPARVGTTEGVARIEDVLDRSVPGWRGAEVWRRGHVVANATGALDPPGTTWRDRPAIAQGDDRFVAGDAVAAPGLLSEVSVNSAVQAARLALEARRQRAFAPGWPRVELTARARLEILAAALPGAVLEDDAGSVATGSWDREPVEETGPGYRLARHGPLLLGAGVGRDGRIRRLVATTSPRLPGPVSKLLARSFRVRRAAVGGPRGQRARG